MSTSPSIREVLARRIAGEIILSNKPEKTMHKWRELFAVSQATLSEKMLLSPSVISDYESGIRKNPGTRFVRKFIWALLQIDEERGERFIREFSILTSSPSIAVLDLREFPMPVRVEYLCKAIKGEIVTRPSFSIGEVRGYTVVDSGKAVETLSGFEYAQLFGANTERALIFTHIENGISPMMLVRMSSLKPKVAVYHGFKPDEYSIRLARYDRIPLLYTPLPSVEQLIKSLRKLYRIALHKKLGRPLRPSPKVST